MTTNQRNRGQFVENHVLMEQVAPQDFKARYCMHYQCPPEVFETRMFKKCLHQRGRIFCWMVGRFLSQFFYSDLVFLRNAAMAKDYQELRRAIKTYKLDCDRDPTFLHDTLKFRISCRKVWDIFTELNKPTIR